MIHPDTELRFANPRIGHGVFATRFVPKGTITWVRDRLDQAFTPVAVGQLPAVYHDIILKYSFIDARGHFVLCWDHARFVNHSCTPTCRSAGYDFELAVRDIQPGEELTDDYGSLNLEYDFDCSCGVAACRRQIRPGDLLRYGDMWDSIVADAFHLIPTVPQPLWQLVDEKDAVESALAGRSRIASVKGSYVNTADLLCGYPPLVR